MPAPLLITADQVNCLIHAYFLDSGFQHSAFALRMEGRLDHSPHIKKHIPRGELIELLSKALLYTEVEAHWKGDELTTNCSAPFSLLEPHACSLQPVSSTREPGASKVNGDTTGKRKASTPSEDNRAEKRAKKEQDEKDAQMDVDGTMLTKPKPKDAKPDALRVSPDSVAKKPKAHKPSVVGARLGAVRFLQSHKTEVFVVAWNPSAKGQLVSGSRDAVVNYWTVPTEPNHEPTATIQPTVTLPDLTSASQADLTALSWNHDGSLVAIGSYDSILRICTATGKLYFNDSHHKGPIFAAKFSPSGLWIVTASLDCTSCVWDVKHKRLHRQYRNHGDACCLDVEWLDDSTFASCGADKVVHVVSLTATGPLHTLGGHEGEINSIKCNPSRTRLASCADDGTARIWNIDNIHSEKVLPVPVVLNGHQQCLTSVEWCPTTGPDEHELVATASFDATARLWDTVTGDCIKIFTDHTKHVYALTFSPDGRHLVTGGGDGSLLIYEVKSKEKKWSWYTGEKSGIFEIDWRSWGDTSLIALALERQMVAVIDPGKVPALQCP
ncbi:WD40 repeat-like protein [Rhizopogon salebrosus TDB-379]|nr:WD40 repeat-like protein [Rhizopogon salebrosus TDB-379]